MWSIFLCAVFFLLPGTAGAELIEMRSGQVFDGEVIQETEDILTIREPAGDGYAENNYEKSQIVRVGERLLGDAGAQRSDAGSAAGGHSLVARQAVEPDWESAERIEYERSLRQIGDEIVTVKRMWDSDRSDLGRIKEWAAKFRESGGRIQEKYRKSALVSYSYLSGVFVEIEHFSSAVADMERVHASYLKSIERNAAGYQRRFEECYKENERLACEALRNAVKYVDMAKMKAAKR